MAFFSTFLGSGALSPKPHKPAQLQQNLKQSSHYILDSRNHRHENKLFEILTTPLCFIIFVCRLLESDDKWGTSCKNKDGSNTNSPSTVTPASASCEIVVKKDDNNNKLSSHPAYVSVITTHDQQQQQQQQHHLNQTDSSFISLENFLSDVNSFQLDQSISNQFLPQSLPSATSQHHQQRRQQQHQQHSQNSLYDVILASLDDSTSTGDGGGSSMHHPHGQISSNYQHLPSPPIVSPVSEENSFFGGQPLHNHVNNNSSFPSSFTSTSVENSSSLSSSSSPALADMGSMYMPENSTSEHLSSAFPILSNCYPHPSLLSGSGVMFLCSYSLTIY